MNFSERVKKLKSETHMTSDELSLRSGIPLGTLTKILSGAINEPKLSYAVAIARAFDCSLTYLACGEIAGADDRENTLIRNYRASDEHGRTLIDTVAANECKRTEAQSGAKILPYTADKSRSRRKIQVPYFLQPVSAGVGTALDGSDCETIDVPASKSAEEADFALRVSGRSMEPAFSDGDVLLVKFQESVNVGELGIFVADGEGFFKRFMGDRLHSLNSDYADIPLSNFTDFSCRGKVIGHLRKKKRTSPVT